jgi:hypothetical protein
MNIHAGEMRNERMQAMRRREKKRLRGAMELLNVI